MHSREPRMVAGLEGGGGDAYAPSAPQLRPRAQWIPGPDRRLAELRRSVAAAAREKAEAELAEALLHRASRPPPRRRAPPL